MSESRRVLVVAAHPDDEILGCGGTVALHTIAGDRVWSLIACEGESMRYGDEPTHQDQHTERARDVLGVERVIALGLPDQRLDTLSLVEIITPLEEAIDELRPHVVYCHHGGDINRDHQLLFEALLVATRPNRDHIETVLAFDTASSTEWGYPRTFVPDTWVDIASTLETKLDAMAQYERELRDFPHPRSLRGLRSKAEAWGTQACMEAAEVFMTVRRVSRNGETGA
ncbi:MAG: PIG-L deacetylase family protein [Actinomycetota bacterium]